jgi:hypothetical protein
MIKRRNFILHFIICFIGIISYSLINFKSAYITDFKVDKLGLNCQQRRMYSSSTKCHTMYKMVCFLKKNCLFVSPLCILKLAFFFIFPGFHLELFL